MVQMLTEQKIETPPGLRLAHRLLQGYYRVPLDAPLNLESDDQSFQGPLFSPGQFFRLSRRLEAEAVTDGGRAVDYARLRSSSIYLEFQAAARRLHFYNPETLFNREGKLAFWINLYNVLVLDAVIQFEVRNSVHEIRGFFWKAAYSIGGQRYSAHDIEHGILRANSPHPAIPGRHFGGQDGRRHNSLATLDPRIHFALNCASISCPPIAVYAPDKIDRELDLAARSFINHGGVAVDFDTGEIRLSKIFQWYANDFGGPFLALGSKQPLIDYVTPYIEGEDKRRFVQAHPARVSFLPYYWELNRFSGLSA